MKLILAARLTLAKLRPGQLWIRSKRCHGVVPKLSLSDQCLIGPPDVVKLLSRVVGWLGGWVGGLRLIIKLISAQPS